MAKNKAILDRIHTVQLTKQITQTMKMVAASSLEKKKKETAHIASYAEEVEKLLFDLLPSPKALSSPFLKKKKLKKALLIVVGTNKGMCGAFLHTLLEKSLRHYQESQSGDEEQPEVLPLGKKAVLFCQQKNILHLTDYSELKSDIEDIQELADSILDLFRSTYDRVEVIYQPRGLNPQPESVVVEQLLPIALPAPESGLTGDESPFLWEPSHEEVIEDLLPQVFTLRLCRALALSHAAEQKARMVTMHQATENAEGLLKELKISYNRARQTKITTEIAEINAGTKFLNS